MYALRTELSRQCHTVQQRKKPVTIEVKGEEEKGLQEKYLTIKFTKVAEKKLPVDFKRGLFEVKGEDVNFPYIYEVKFNTKGEKEYPEVWIRSFESISPVKGKARNTCSFLVDEEETEELEIE